MPGEAPLPSPQVSGSKPPHAATRLLPLLSLMADAGGAAPTIAFGWESIQAERANEFRTNKKILRTMVSQISEQNTRYCSRRRA